jgi:hypothetical protein
LPQFNTVPQLPVCVSVLFGTLSKSFSVFLLFLIPYTIYTICVLHVSATLTAILREVHREDGYIDMLHKLVKQ